MNFEVSSRLRGATFVLSAIAGLLIGCGGTSLTSLTPAPPVVATNVDQDVASVERAFAATMAKRDLVGFASFLSDEAVFVSETRALRGKSQVIEAWKRFFEKPAAPFSWEPEHVEVLDSGSLALSTGPVRTPDGNTVATFTSIWRKEPTGWHIIFDRGVDRQECSAPEATSALPVTKPDFAAYRQHLVEAQAAYTRKDFAAFLALTQQAAAAMPNGPRVIYNEACGYALTGKYADALTNLQKLVSMKLYFDVMQDDDLASLRNMPEFVAIRGQFAALEKNAIGKSVPAFTLPERDMIPEGIAHDAKTGTFFVSSVHKRKILRILPNGKTSEFASAGLFAVLGMAIDEKRRALWACSTALPEMKGFSEADKGRAKVVEFDVDTGKVRRTITLDERGVNHMCNDLAVDGEGNVFVSDPGTSTLFTLAAGAQTLEVFVPAGKFAAPQGIALNGDGQSMFVADYSRGLFHVDRTTRETTWLAPPNDATLVGIDGLAMARGDLVAIQNGTRPHRVLRIKVDAAAKTVRRVEVLQMNHAAFDEPTLGVVVGKELFYVANSQWGSFDKGVIRPLDKLKEPVILRLGLDR